MLPMLITLPGPGGGSPPAIDVEVLQPAPVLPKHATDPVTTSALPKVEAPPVEPRTEQTKPEDAAKPATAEPNEVPPDDMPQQIATPVAPLPAQAGIDALTPEPLAAAMVNAPALEPQAPEEVKQVALEPDITTTSSILPVATNPEAENLGEAEAEIEASAPPVSETLQPKPESQPEMVRADPGEETPPQAAIEEDAVEAETPAAAPPVARPAAGKKPSPQTKPKAEVSAKAKAKTEPAAAKKRQTATAKRIAPQRSRVVRGRPQTPMNQGIMSFFGSALKPPAGVNASARRPVIRQ
jgi:ribonuclease E